MSLGFKGERGYSAYEIAVQNGYVGSEESWLAQLGTQSSFEQSSTTYTTTEADQTIFDLPEGYTSNCMLNIYVAGNKLTSSDYTINTTTNKIVLTTGITTVGTKVEVEMTKMSSTAMPIVTELTSSSTDNTAPSAKCVYNLKETLETAIETNETAIETNEAAIETLTTNLETQRVPAGGTAGQVLIKNTDDDNDAIWASLLELIHPIGSIYVSASSTSPANIFGGTWVQLKDRFIIGAGGDYELNETGGSNTHTLTLNELPRFNTAQAYNTTGQGWTLGNGGTPQLYSTGNQTVGNSQPIDTTPQYIALNIWQRTA